MSDSLETFFSAWSMAGEGSRAEAIARATNEAVVYADPRSPGPLEGREALSNYVGAFAENAPGWTARVIKQDQTEGMSRATVAFGGKGPDGKDMVQHGQYFSEFDAEGRIKKMTGFVGTGAPE